MFAKCTYCKKIMWPWQVSYTPIGILMHAKCYEKEVYNRMYKIYKENSEAIELWIKLLKGE